LRCRVRGTLLGKPVPASRDECSREGAKRGNHPGGEGCINDPGGPLVDDCKRRTDRERHDEESGEDEPAQLRQLESSKIRSGVGT
jgi:hypothetical protein